MELDGNVSKHDLTIFSAAPASAVRYRVGGMNRDLMREINSMVDDGGCVDVSARCAALLDAGCELDYDGCAFSNRAGCEVFRDNLDLINPRLPIVIERLLWYRFFATRRCAGSADVVRGVIAENPCGVSRPEVKYPYMIKSFLYAAWCGMTASELWDGSCDAKARFAAADEKGDVLACYASGPEAFREHLYRNCRLEPPATSQEHSDYAYVYESDGSYFFDLSFQIRYLTPRKPS